MDLLHTHKKTCSLDGINHDRKNNQLILYTPSFGPRTKTNGLGIEVVIADGYVIHKGGNDNLIPENGLVLSGSGLARDWIETCIFIGSVITYDEVTRHVDVLSPEVTAL